MAPNSLSPASVLIDYHSAFSPHKMTLCTKDWIPTPVSGSIGSYLDWNGDPVDAEQMVNDLVDKLKVLVPPTTHFDQATVYTKVDANAPNIPRAAVALTQVGTSSGTGASAAVSCTLNFKTTGNGDAKIVVLEVPIGTNWFAPILPADFTTAFTDIAVQFGSSGNAWSGRDDNQPQVLRKVTFDLNDKLQKMYWG